MAMNWERVTVVARDMPGPPPSGGTLTLSDGRTILIPADTQCMNKMFQYDETMATSQKWREMLDATQPGRSVRLLLAGDRMAGVGTSMRMHPVDKRILEAFGHDVDAAAEAKMSRETWLAPGTIYDAPPTPGDIYSTNRNRLTGRVKISDGVTYDKGKLLITGQEIPETVGSVLAGMPLSRLIAIPALAALDPLIVDVEQKPDLATGRTTIIVLLADDQGCEEIR